ncbi:MAG: hypothetical protein JNK72_11640 [Myxococcales bacterium]|nr:hypothetical protein [Myxococcales bacterium]
MFLRLVTAGEKAPRSVVSDGQYPFAETPLVVVFAAVDDLSAVAAGARVSLAAAPELSADDAYLVLPLRARDALVAAFARGRGAAIAAWFDEAVVVRAEVDTRPSPRLWVGAAWRAASVLAGGASRSLSSADAAALQAFNALPHVEGLAPGGLLDRPGLAALTASPAYVGVSRRGVPALGLFDDAVAPTFVWAERTAEGVSVRVALSASEDDAMVALLAPIDLVA